MADVENTPADYVSRPHVEWLPISNKWCSLAEERETHNSILERFSRFIHRMMRVCRLVSRPPAGWKSINSELERRTYFPAEAWSSYEVPLRQVLPVLEMIQSSGCWPNYNLLPEDHLVPLFLCSLYPMAFEDFSYVINKQLGVDITSDRYKSFLTTNVTLGEFISKLTADADERGCLFKSFPTLWHDGRTGSRTSVMSWPVL